MRALISWLLYAFPSMSIFQSVPMWRFTDRIVRSGLVIAWRLATSPTRTSPVFENATTEGVVRAPSALGITDGSPASSTATTELVVPRSMPTALDMGKPPVTSIENLSVSISTLAGGRLFPCPGRREGPVFVLQQAHHHVVVPPVVDE